MLLELLLELVWLLASYISLSNSCILKFNIIVKLTSKIALDITSTVH